MTTRGVVGRPSSRHLPADLAVRFDRLRAELGREGLATRLGVSCVTVEKLEHGGHATPSAVARVVAAMEGGA